MKHGYSTLFFSLLLISISGVTGCKKESPVAESTDTNGVDNRANSATEEVEEAAFEPKIVIDKAFPPIKDAEFFDIEQGNSFVEDNELVLGVSDDEKGIAKAYPINMLGGPRREIINDQLGDRAIAATW